MKPQARVLVKPFVMLKLPPDKCALGYTVCRQAFCVCSRLSKRFRKSAMFEGVLGV